jgi:hypothetical protein
VVVQPKSAFTSSCERSADSSICAASPEGRNKWGHSSFAREAAKGGVPASGASPFASK